MCTTAKRVALLSQLIICLVACSTETIATVQPPSVKHCDTSEMKRGIIAFEYAVQNTNEALVYQAQFSEKNKATVEREGKLSQKEIEASKEEFAAEFHRMADRVFGTLTTYAQTHGYNIVWSIRGTQLMWIGTPAI